MNTCRISAVILCLLYSLAAAAPSPASATQPAAGRAPIFPPPFMAVARTPRPIELLKGGALHIQADTGFKAGFSGFIDTATGQFGFPGFRGVSNLDISFDEQKLCLWISMPYPPFRTLRAGNGNDRAALLADDVFEILINPRDRNGRPGDTIYRVIGNAAGAIRLERDAWTIGQPNQTWNAKVAYAVMRWDPAKSWMAGVQIPFADLGGAPADGQAWGIQMALRYADPVMAVLSPSEKFADVSRFATLRFDLHRRANFICHDLNEGIRTGTFSLGKLYTNGGNEVVPLDVEVRLLRGKQQFARSEFRMDAQPLKTHGITFSNLYMQSQPATPQARDTVAHIVARDATANTVIYEQYLPYWMADPHERDWLTERQRSTFTFNIGPYPSLGLFDFEADASLLKSAVPGAHSAVLSVTTGGRRVAEEKYALPSDGRLRGQIKAGRFEDGATYQCTMRILGAADKVLAEVSEEFTRQVMPFEKAARGGLSDIVPPPFTPVRVQGAAIECVGRTYHHGQTGLLERLEAAGADILAGPVQFKIAAGGGPAAALAAATAPALRAKGQSGAESSLRFEGGGVKVDLTGTFDYDGFYRFDASLTKTAAAAEVRELYLEIPLKQQHAILIDAPVDILVVKGWETCTDLLPTQAGRLWDSKRFPYDATKRRSNLPPYCWIGDDERGICFSTESQQGMFNNDDLPALTIDREADRVVMRIWFVNKPVQLSGERRFSFALQASPYKPIAPDHRLWRMHSGKNSPLGDAGTFFHHGWGIGSCYPAYGRFMNLDLHKKEVEAAKADGYEHVAVQGSACSESGGQPEYKQFWREWGSPLGWPKIEAGPLPQVIADMMTKAGVEPDPKAGVDALSNISPTNVDYRVWWYEQMVRHCGNDHLYQDNPPCFYVDQEPLGFGYVRDDGRREPISVTWRSRDFIRRVLHVTHEAGAKTPAPGVWPNFCGVSQPGRSLSFRGLVGEYTESDKLPLGSFRVWGSRQWGMNVDWLMQEPNAGATMKYWRALCSRLFLMDITSFSRYDPADMARYWEATLDAFRLVDGNGKMDASVVWHPYYRNPTVRGTERPSTLISTYTGSGRALFVVSNQGTDAVIEQVKLGDLAAFGGGAVQHFYDAETGEAIEFKDGQLHLYLRPADFRLVLGFSSPWRASAQAILGGEAMPAQSTLDAHVTLAALCGQLLRSPDVSTEPGQHEPTARRLGRILQEIKAQGNVTYLDAAACKGILNDPNIETAVLYAPGLRAILVVYLNPTNTDRLLGGQVRAALFQKLGIQPYAYVMDPLTGRAHYTVIDLPAGAGKLELIYTDSVDFWGVRRGPLPTGGMLHYLRQAAAAGLK